MRNDLVFLWERFCYVYSGCPIEGVQAELILCLSRLVGSGDIHLLLLYTFSGKLYRRTRFVGFRS